MQNQNQTMQADVQNGADPQAAADAAAVDPAAVNATDSLAQNPYINTTAAPAPLPTAYQTPTQNTLLRTGFSTTELLAGAVVGAAAMYVLTNESVQKRLFKGVAMMSDALSGGLDELKERYEDARAEYEAEKSGQA